MDELEDLRNIVAARRLLFDRHGQRVKDEELLDIERRADRLLEAVRPRGVVGRVLGFNPAAIVALVELVLLILRLIRELRNQRTP